DLIIRGGAPNENRFFIDDVEIPTINHFATQGSSGGPAGIINVDFIREVDFYSGAFPAGRYNSLSSVFNFKFKEGRDDRIGSTITLGAQDFGVSLDGPINDKSNFRFSARRSYLQLLFGVLGLPILPTYNDFQFRYKYKIDKKNEITILGIGAIDRFKLNLEADDTESKQFIINRVPINNQWNYTNGLVYKHFGNNGFTTFVISRSMLDNRAFKYLNNDESSLANKILDYKSQEIENKLRVENTTKTNQWTVNTGISYEFAKFNNNTFNKIFTPQGPLDIDFTSFFTMHKYGAFGTANRNFANDRLTLSLGLRMDGNSFSNDMSNPLEQLSPRMSIAYALTPKLSLNFNTGIYHQLPPYTSLGYNEGGVFVNRQNDITYINNKQIVTGFEYNTNFSSKISVEGYYKDYANYPFLTRQQVSLANLGSDFGVIGNEPSI
ncbi:MAG TPA: TonB-dependent receptor, partial [Saprospiraceae bacterium]|nr:TonB-dependent receptor [Saprospiraceae bacterium]